ncbi:MAG: putative sugar phosphate isomerase YwlF [candidate division WS2 bacterium]|nr:putative sugar phosphate isomerase YwlF [Candidatus Lithacetigena glycinireducens]
MIIALGADHKGLILKEKVKSSLQSEGHQVIDFGTHSDVSVDYSDYAREVALAVSRGEAEAGVLICWTGIGMAISSNKIKGVRSFVANDIFTARLSREHNNTNIICFGGGMIGEDYALEILKVWLSSSFVGGRHRVRLGKISDIEEGK